MKFDEYETLYQMTKGHKSDPEQFYYLLLQHANAKVYTLDEDEKGLTTRLVQEALWYNENRPFYKVWPSIIPPLTKTQLNLSLTDLKMTQRTVLAQLPAGQGTMLITTGPKPYLILTVSLPSEKLAATVTLDDPKQPIEGQVEHHPKFMPKLRLAVAILILEHDPSIVEPAVLCKDKQKWAMTHDVKYVEKARKRGLYGWHIGEHTEKSPHIRSPHFAIRWTGSGRTIPKLCRIRGSVVHRDIITQIPTGHLDHDNSSL